MISILIILYGCIKSLRMDQKRVKDEHNNPLINQKQEENDDDDDDDNNDDIYNNNNNNNNNNPIQTITLKQALLIPVISSASLLIMFLFIDSIQIILVLLTSILAIIAFSYLLTPVSKIVLLKVISSEIVK